MTELKGIISKMEGDMTTLKKEHSTTMAQIMDDHEKAIAEVGEQFKSKLIVEYQKYDNLEDMYKALRKGFDKKMVEMNKETEQNLKEMDAKFKQKLDSNNLEVKKHEKLGMEKVRAVEEMLKQTEEDADKEILELKTKYEKILRNEREANVRLRGESGIVRKKLQSVLKDMDEYRTNIAKMTTENQKLHSTIKNMEKDINDLKHEIKNRDETISEKGSIFWHLSHFQVFDS